MDARSIAIVGGGPNGLVAACYLAKAGWKPIVLERRASVGGVASTEEFAPGFRCSSVLHVAGPFLPSIASDLGLDRHGLSWIHSEVRVFAAEPDGRGIRLYGDPRKTAAELEAVSPHDARGYLVFHESLGRIGRVLEPLLTMTPPSIDDPSFGEMWDLFGVGRRFHALPRRDAFRLLRWGPMAVADLVSEFFETELLRAAVAARGIYGTFAGPWSAGTSLGVILQAASDANAAGPAGLPRGGMGALTQALASAARALGAEIRTGAPVARIQVRDGAATGVVLETGEEVTARAVVSNADPKRTFLGLIEKSQLDEGFRADVESIAMAGPCAKVNFALDQEPRWHGMPEDADPNQRSLATLVPTLEGAQRMYDQHRWGEIPDELWVDCVTSSNVDDTLAPPGTHVMTAFVQYVPFELRSGTWDELRDELGRKVVETISRSSDNVATSIRAMQVVTPLDLERTYGLTEGNIFHGDLNVEQLFFMRPLPAWSRYRTPIDGLYLCGAGTHPGGGVTGAPGYVSSRAVLKDLKRRRS